MSEIEINPINKRNGAQVAEQAKQSAPVDVEAQAELVAKLEKIASEYGLEAYAESWSKLTKAERQTVGADEHERLKGVATSIASEVINQETGEVTK